MYRRWVAEGRYQVPLRPGYLILLNDNAVGLMDVDSSSIGHVKPHIGDQIACYVVAKRNIRRTGTREVVLARNFACILKGIDRVNVFCATYCGRRCTEAIFCVSRTLRRSTLRSRTVVDIPTIDVYPGKGCVLDPVGQH